MERLHQLLQRVKVLVELLGELDLEDWVIFP